jgi:hypothetical protein
MAKRTVKEKEILDHLQKEGFKEIKEAEQPAKWYRKASERPSCLKVAQRKKIKS